MSNENEELKNKITELNDTVNMLNQKMKWNEELLQNEVELKYDLQNKSHVSKFLDKIRHQTSRLTTILQLENVSSCYNLRHYDIISSFLKDPPIFVRKLFINFPNSTGLISLTKCFPAVLVWVERVNGEIAFKDVVMDTDELLEIIHKSNK